MVLHVASSPQCIAVETAPRQSADTAWTAHDAEQQMHQSAAIQGIGALGLEPQRLLAIVDRRFQLANDRTHPAAVVPSPGVGRMGAHDLVVIDQRAVVPVLRLVSGGAVVVGAGEMGVEPYRHRRTFN